MDGGKWYLEGVDCLTGDGIGLIWSGLVNGVGLGSV